MKIVKKTLLVVAVLVSVLVAVLIGTFTSLSFWAYYHPKQVWKIVEENFLPEDLKIEWDHLQFEIHHLSGLNFTLDFNITSLLIKKTNPSLAIPINYLQINSSVFPFKKTGHLIIHQIKLRAPQAILIRLSKNKRELQLNPFQQLQMALQKVSELSNFLKFEDIDFNISKLIILNSDVTATNVHLEIHKDQKSVPEQIVYKTKVSTTGGLNIDSRGSISFFKTSTEERQLNRQLNLQLNLQLDLKFRIQAPGIKASLELNGKLGDHSKIKSVGSFYYKKNKLHISGNPKINIKMNSRVLNIRVDSDINGLPESFVKLNNIQAQLKIPLKKDKQWSSEPSSFSLSAPVYIFSGQKKYTPR